MVTVGRLEELAAQMFMTFASMKVEREAEDVDLPMGVSFQTISATYHQDEKWSSLTTLHLALDR
jgi:hypothetical protein